MQNAALCARARCPGGAVWRGRYPDPCCVCVPGGLCDRACFVRVCVLGSLPDMRTYEMGRAGANVIESGPWFAATSAVHYTSGLVYRAFAQGPVCQTALGLV